MVVAVQNQLHQSGREPQLSWLLKSPNRLNYVIVQRNTPYCPKFTALSPKERYNKVKKANKCIQCLESGHQPKECTRAKCSTCGRPHHTLLHFPQNDNQQATNLLGSAMRNPGFQHVFLGTAIVHVHDANGVPMEARILLKCSRTFLKLKGPHSPPKW